MKKLIPIVILLVQFCTFTTAQSTTVEVLNYNTDTRDTLVEFPTGDHNDYKKIIMHYSMRCKDGLVSPPVTGQTNIGCGEWDYSCNTNIVDSTRVDSLKAIAPDHVITNFSGEVYEYTSQQTHTGYRTTKFQVEHISGSANNTLVIADGNSINGFGVMSLANIKKHIITVSKVELDNAGIVAGDIERLQFDVINGSQLVKNLRVSMVHVNENDDINDILNTTGWTEVVYDDITISSASPALNFYKPFSWDGNNDIALMLSYDKDSPNGISFAGSLDGSRSMNTFTGTDDQYMQCSPLGHLELADGLPEISNEITVAFWSKGNNTLPSNTSLVECGDNNGLRSVNVHLPWSNGQVYWDCGNEGGSYDRINKSADPNDYKNKWTHWAFTKNATTGDMKIYLNGNLWHSGTGFHRSIDINSMIVGSSLNGNLIYDGDIDDFRIWKRELSELEIQEAMRVEISSNHATYDDLVINYDFTNSNGNDLSSFNNDAEIVGTVNYRNWVSKDLAKNMSVSNDLPKMQLQQGTFDFQLTELEVDELIPNNQDKIEYYELQGTDRVLVDTRFAYAAGSHPIYDENFNIVDSITYPAEESITITDIEYFSKSPMVYELMSFVTPYGINLDLGIEGKTWSFDVTEFGPILKGKKRIFLNRGGQNQEDMDIRFEFIEGTPVRDVIDIKQMWPVTATPFAQILDNYRFEPREISLVDASSTAVLKSVITGHGQQGEFIPRTHFVSINGVPFPFTLWTECADNPIYPQGGTWVYDRAGWCPGAPSDVNTFDITPFLQGNGDEVDYSLTEAAGDSRYIVNVQLIEYGEPNYTNDVEILNIINPSSYVEYERYNPACRAPIIKIQNNGSQNVSTLNIRYGLQDDMSSAMTYTWEGDLDFLDEEEVELPFFEGLTTDNNGSNFFVEIMTDDEDPSNNMMTSVISMVDDYEDRVVIQFRTNSAANETIYNVTDQDGNILISKNANSLAPNNTYTDTLSNLNGCYRLSILDSDDDGLAWWANNDGTGFVKIKNVGEAWKTLPQDFGKIYRYEFTAGDPLAINDLTNTEAIKIYPNPTDDGIYIELDEQISKGKISITDELGRKVYETSIFNNDNIYLPEVKSMNPGIYHISIYAEDQIFTQRFVKI